MNLSVYLAAAATLTFSVATLAAGTHSGGHGDGHGSAIGEPGKASEVSRSITVEMHDNYYEPEAVTVQRGETIRFVVENKGNLVHEFNIGTPEMHEAHQEEMQMMVEHGVIQGGSINHDMMNMEMDGHSMKHEHANSVLLEPGQRKEIIWTFTEEASIEFACNVPGHYQAGMYGDINFN